MPLGSCLCCAVQFESSAELTDLCFCHCSICRKASGAANAAYGSAKIKDFSWSQGEDLIRKYQISDSLYKLFCSRCGSTLPTCHNSEPESFHLSLGNLDSSINNRPEYHQYVADKASWDEINDGLAQFPGWPEQQNP